MKKIIITAIILTLSALVLLTALASCTENSGGDETADDAGTTQGIGESDINIDITSADESCTTSGEPESTTVTAEAVTMSPYVDKGVRHPTKLANDEKDTDPKESSVKTVNILGADFSDYDGAVTVGDTGWSTSEFGGTLKLEGNSDNKYIHYTGVSNSWISPTFNLRPHITEAGDYEISFEVWFDGGINTASSLFSVAIRGTKPNSFMTNQGGNIFKNVYTASGKYTAGEKITVTFRLSVEQKDLTDGNPWNLCLHELDSSVSGFCIDNLTIGRSERADEPVSIPTEAVQWMANELVLNAGNAHDDPVNSTEIDIILTKGSTKLTVPGFWDGGNTWKFRIALTEIGEWQFETLCTDKTDKGLHGITGKINCKAYEGDLEVYKRGFVDIKDGNRYFTYTDGTPFLYLGDTHWTMPKEEYTSAGVNAGDTGTASHFRYIVRKRVEQGFTVYQSEPLESGIDARNGISESDVAAFQSLDLYFAYIARHGLTHANALLMFPSDMVEWLKTSKNFDAELRAAVRYWVARYSAYPVLWTLGQETDKDFYGQFKVSNNPYIRMCELVNEFDAYKHPITAHQENVTYTKANDSAFLNAAGHNWFGAQWSPALKGKFDFDVAKEYWASGRLTILYESLYDHLWTNNFGARAEGWIAYLSGMYGYGYGAEDIWYYRSSYDMDTTSNNYDIVVTPEDKAVKWCDSVEFVSAYQAGYMLDFFDTLEWWKLTPAFDNKDIFTPDTACRSYVVANNENLVYVMYFFGTSVKTGTLKSLDSRYGYTARWYDPQTGKYSGEAINVPAGTEYVIGDKPDKADWVLIVYASEVISE